MCKSNWNRLLVEPCVSCIYLTYCMEYIWKSSLWIGIFQRAKQRARILLSDNIQSGGSFSVNYLKRSCPSDYIRHIHHAFIIIFETRHTGLIMALLNVLVKLLPSLPFRLSPCFFIGVHRFLSTSCFYFHLLNFLGYARGTYLILQPRFYRLPRVRHSIRSHTFSGSVFSVLFPFCLQYFLSCILCFGCICF